MQYGIQLYSVKDFMKDDVRGTLRQIAALGYKAVEPAGFFGTSAADFKAWCDESGLAVWGSHNHLGDLEGKKFGEAVDYFHKIGCEKFIVASADFKTAESLDRTIDALNRYAPMLKAEGIELLYHNHHREFRPNADGQIAHVEMQKRTDIRFEIDIYWAYRGGVSPIYVLEQLKDRVPIIHLKDGTLEKGSPLGEGSAPIAEVVAWAKANGVQMVVENEPTADRQMIEAGICIDYLQGLEG